MSFTFKEEKISLKRLIVAPEDYVIKQKSIFREVDEKDIAKLGYVKQSDYDLLKSDYEFEKIRADNTEKLYTELQTILSKSSVVQ